MADDHDHRSPTVRRVSSPPGTTARRPRRAIGPRPGQGGGRGGRGRRASATSTAPLADGDRSAIVTPDTDAGRHVLRHSTAHVMAQAVSHLFPGAKFAIGPPIEDGFYYDFELPDGAHVQRRRPRAHRGPDARDHRRAEQPFVRDEIRRRRGAGAVRRPAVQARDHRRRRRRGRRRRRRPRSPAARVSVVPTTPPKFVDLCRGPARRRAPAGSATSSCMRVAGAYWRGDEKSPMLQRIYGTAWDQKAARRPPPPPRGGREARPPQARRRARPVSASRTRSAAGLAVCHPKGGIVRRLMEDYSRAPPRAGRLRVRLHAAHREGRRCSRRRATSTGTPTACTRRWRWTTGTLLPKPMNCPFHILIFAAGSAATASCRCGCSSSAPSTATRARACCTASRACGA